MRNSTIFRWYNLYYLRIFSFNDKGRNNKNINNNKTINKRQITNMSNNKNIKTDANNNNMIYNININVNNKLVIIKIMKIKMI